MEFYALRIYCRNFGKEMLLYKDESYFLVLIG